MATDFVYLHFFLNPLSLKNEVHASYKQGYGNNEHVATAWLLSVELKCWFLAQLVSSTLTISTSLSYSLANSLT